MYNTEEITSGNFQNGLNDVKWPSFTNVLTVYKLYINLH